MLRSSSVHDPAAPAAPSGIVSLSGDRAAAFERGGDRIERQHVVAPREASRNGWQRRSSRIDAADRGIGGFDRAGERAVRGLARMTSVRSVAGNAPFQAARSTPLASSATSRNDAAASGASDAWPVNRAVRAVAGDVEREPRERTLEHDVGLGARERGIALRLEAPAMGKRCAGAERRIARDRTEGRHERGVGDPVLLRRRRS